MGTNIYGWVQQGFAGNIDSPRDRINFGANLVMSIANKDAVAASLAKYKLAHDDGESTEGCNYLMTVDMEMDPIPGYEIASTGARIAASGECSRAAGSG